MKTQRAVIASVALGAALVAAACSVNAGSTVAGDKSGNPPAPITLTLVTTEQPGRPGADMVERFMAAVDQLSDGHITIKPTFDDAIDQPVPTDQLNIESLSAGDFDLAFVPARAWHSDGVTTLEPLQLPFVVETDEQANRVATDPGLSDALLEGLATINVTGLGLYPEGERHLVRLDGTPIGASGDLGGLSVRAPVSDTTWEVLKALGANVVDLAGAALNDAVVGGRVAAAESSLVLTSTLPATGRPSVLANVSLYTKFNVLAISNAALSGWDEHEAVVVRDAAKAALTETLARRPRESVALADACRLGISTVLASEVERAALQRRLMSVVRLVSTAAHIDSLLQRVRDVAGPAVVPANPGCPHADNSGDGRAINVTKLRPIPGDLPDGNYRFAVDSDAILASYPNFPRSRLKDYSAVFTIGLHGGHHTIDVVAESGETLHYTNVYEVHGSLVTFAFPSGSDFYTPMAVSWRWAAEPDGSVKFEPLTPQDRGERVDYTDLMTIPVWRRVS